MNKAIVYMLRYFGLFLLSFASGFYAKEGQLFLYVAALLTMLAFFGLDYRDYLAEKRVK